MSGINLAIKGETYALYLQGIKAFEKMRIEITALPVTLKAIESASEQEIRSLHRICKPKPFGDNGSIHSDSWKKLSWNVQEAANIRFKELDLEEIEILDHPVDKLNSILKSVWGLFANK